MEWPVRGTLAADQDYLRDAKRYFDVNLKDMKVKPSNIHLIYASDVGDLRIVVAAFLMGEPDKLDGPQKALMYSHYTTKKGTETVPDPKAKPDWSAHPNEMQKYRDALNEVESADSQSRNNMVVLRGTGELLGGRTLAIAAPGVTRLELSRRPEYHAGGTITRAWENLEDLHPAEGIFLLGDTGSSLLPRIRAIADNRVVAEQRLEWSERIPPASEITRLENLIAAGSDGRPVGRFAIALRHLETRFDANAITRVEILRTEGSTAKDFWVSALVYLKSGATFEVYFNDDPARKDRDERDVGPALVQIVTKSQAVTGISAWIDDRRCIVRGWDTGNRVAAVELSLSGKAYPRASTTGRPIHANFCKAVGESSWHAKPYVKLFDKAGKQIWSGTPVYNQTGGTTSDYENLEAPPSLGEEVP